MPRPFSPPRVFFAHVMKTGGWSFHTAVSAHLDPSEVWSADAGSDARSRQGGIAAAMSVAGLLELDEAERTRYRFYSGHFPLVAATLAGDDVLVATIVRDPVARTLSFLSHAERGHHEHHGLPLEEIYEDPWWGPRFITDHQTKVLSMTFDEMVTPTPPPAAPLGMTHEEFGQVIAHTTAFAVAIADPPIARALPMDCARLATATANLDAIALLGVTERYDEFVARVADRTGWALDAALRLNAAPAPIRVPESFRRRIAEDNSLDMALYEHARSLLG